MECGGEDLSEPFSFPAKGNCTNRRQGAAIETNAVVLVASIHAIEHSYVVKCFDCDPIEFGPGIQCHLALNMGTEGYTEDLHRLQERISWLLGRSELC